MQSLLASFRQNRLLATFGGYLEFLRKIQRLVYLRMEQVRVILTKLLSHRDICIVYWRVFTEILLPPLLAAILNFFIKCKNVFILEMERARAILTKSLIHSASCTLLKSFCQNPFPTTFGGHLEFLRKMCLSWKRSKPEIFRQNF